MSSDQLGSIYTIVSIVAGLGALGAYIQQAVNKLRANQEQSAINKANELKRSSEDIATNVKKNADDRAEELKEATEEIAKNIKTEAERRADSLEKATENRISLLVQKIDQVDSKVMTMLEGLTDRSDLVNGNIASIRSDIADLQDDIFDLNDQGGEDTSERRRRRNMTDKRRRIEADRISQQERPKKKTLLGRT